MFTYISIFVTTQFIQFTHLRNFRCIGERNHRHDPAGLLVGLTLLITQYCPIGLRTGDFYIFIFVHYRYCPARLWIGMSLSIISFAVLLHLSLLVYQSIPNSNLTNILLRTLIIYHSSYKILFSIPLYSHFHNTIHIFDRFVCTYLHSLSLDRSFINDLSTHLRGQLNI